LTEPFTDYKFEHGRERVDVLLTAEWTWPFYKAQVGAFIELKPSLGQDYPQVLRQILNKIPPDQQPGKQLSSASEFRLVTYFLLIKRYLPTEPLRVCPPRLLRKTPDSTASSR